MDKTTLYFGDNGLTSTSATHLANLGKEHYRGIEQRLKAVCFYDTEATLVAADKSVVISKGVTEDELDALIEDVMSMGKTKALIGWLREAVKAKEALLESVKNLALEEYCKLKGLQMPEAPKPEANGMDEETYFGMRGADFLNRYYETAAKAANLGKLIHQGGALSNARENLMAKLASPNEVKQVADGMAVYNYKPSVSEKMVDKLFFELQAKYRELQATVNKMQADCSAACRTSEMQQKVEYRTRLEDYNARMKTLDAEMAEYQAAETERILALKIIIPEALRGIYEQINGLGAK